jgi:hypothetical protein
MVRWAGQRRRLAAGLRLFVVEVVVVGAIIGFGVAAAALLLAIL